MNTLIEFGKKAVNKVESVSLAAFVAMAILMADQVSAQTTPTIYDPGVDISGMTGVAADGLGDVVTTCLGVAFGFLVIAIGYKWVRRYVGK